MCVCVWTGRKKERYTIVTSKIHLLHVVSKLYFSLDHHAEQYLVVTLLRETEREGEIYRDRVSVCSNDGELEIQNSWQPRCGLSHSVIIHSG